MIIKKAIGHSGAEHRRRRRTAEKQHAPSITARLRASVLWRRGWGKSNLYWVGALFAEEDSQKVVAEVGRGERDRLGLGRVIELNLRAFETQHGVTVELAHKLDVGRIRLRCAEDAHRWRLGLQQ